MIRIIKWEVGKRSGIVRVREPATRSAIEAAIFNEYLAGINWSWTDITDDAVRIQKGNRHERD